MTSFLISGPVVAQGPFSRKARSIVKSPTHRPRFDLNRGTTWGQQKRGLLLRPLLLGRSILVAALTPATINPKP